MCTVERHTRHINAFTKAPVCISQCDLQNLFRPSADFAKARRELHIGATTDRSQPMGPVVIRQVHARASTTDLLYPVLLPACGRLSPSAMRFEV